MANREACELYIEQQIDEGLEDGKKPYSIGKELSEWIGKKFETYINPNTLRMRAERRKEKVCTNVQSQQDTETTPDSANLKKLEKPTHGGKREGSGRHSNETIIDVVGDNIEKKKNYEVTDAKKFALMATGQLERIRKDDPEREKVLLWVIDWIKDFINK